MATQTQEKLLETFDNYIKKLAVTGRKPSEIAITKQQKDEVEKIIRAQDKRGILDAALTPTSYRGIPLRVVS